MKRGAGSCGRRRGLREALTFKSGNVLMLKDAQRDVVRAMALDRQHSKGVLNAAGASPLKSRPVVVQDLSLYTSPKIGRRRSSNARNFT